MLTFIFWTIYLALGCATVVWTSALGYLDVEDIAEWFIALALIFLWPFALGFALVVLGVSGLIVWGKKIGGIK